MIVGHTWRAKPTWRKSVEYAAFNALYNWETGDYTLKPGAEIWIRTKASGKRWLVYRVTGFSQPPRSLTTTISLQLDRKQQQRLQEKSAPKEKTMSCSQMTSSSSVSMSVNNLQ
jgi:hypothetical protein